MKKILVLVLSLFAQAASAFAIATGPSDGSYFHIAQDIKNVAGKDGVEVQVLPTKGSLENIQLLGSLTSQLSVAARRFACDTAYHRDGNTLKSRDLYLDMAPWRCDVFKLQEKP